MPELDAATSDVALEMQAVLLAALKLLAEMQRNRSIAPAYKRDVERVLSSMAARSALGAVTRAVARYQSEEAT